MASKVCCCLLFAFSFLLCGFNSVKIELDTKTPVAEVHEYYHSITLDTSTIRNRGRVQNIIKNPIVKTLTKALSPSYLRMGGTAANSLYFCEKIEDCKAPNGSVVMTGQDYKDLIEFTKEMSLKLSFNLNAIPRKPDGSWDSTNSVNFLNFLKANNFSSPDWHLGNELNIKKELSGEQLALGYIELKKILTKMGGSFAQSMLMGPEVSGINLPTTHPFVGSFLKKNPPVDVVSAHHYYFNGRKVNLSDYIDISKLNGLKKYILRYKNFVKSIKPNATLWFSETSAGYNTGTPGVSERFAAVFMWLDKLGESAASGISLVARQAIANCNTYCFINNTNKPIPDYWLSVLYKRLVGRKVLKLTTSPNDGTVRLYAHCTQAGSAGYKAGSVTVFGMNVKKAPANVSLGPEFQKSSFDEYMLTGADDGNLLSEHAALNGQRLILTNDSSLLPPLNPVHRNASSTLNFPNFSVAFFVFTGIDAPVCR